MHRTGRVIGAAGAAGALFGSWTCATDTRLRDRLVLAQQPVVPDNVTTSNDSGVRFKADLLNGRPKFGIFVNSASPTVAEGLAHMGYDWLLVDTQHGPMNPESLSTMLAAIGSSGASCRSLVRVGGVHDRSGIQQALDLGADGILIPYINTVEEARSAVDMCKYPTAGTRSVYHPQRSNWSKGLLGYVGNANKNVIVALQVETADCIKNIDQIAAVPGVDLLFLGQNDLCLSMGLFEKYEFPKMYFSPELNDATKKMILAARRNNVALGMFQFGTDRVQEFLEKGFTFISIGNDLHHILTQATAHTKSVKEASARAGVSWHPQPSAINPESNQS